MTVARGNKVLDLAGRGLAQLRAANEVWCKVEFGSIAAGCAIGVPIDSSANGVGHLCNNRGHVRGVR